MTLKLYSTLSREKEIFTPQDAKRVTMYVCGPTVYSYAHIGNGRSATNFDVLYRVLRHQFGEKNVVYARNLTDIDDKINKSAKEQNVNISVITEKFAKIYQDDLAQLGNLSPNIQPKATETIPEIIAMCERLIEAGHAYVAEGHVLFDVPSFKNYGSLSRRNLDEMIAGARVDVAPYKKDATDFVLWKPSTDDLPGWQSPWGRGRPGWHIECSAMIEKHLGDTIDIHCGGIDLVFPHHENEIAQSVCSHDHNPFVRYWLHNGFLTMDNEKMSKSLGNILLIHDVIKQYPPEAIRMSLLSAHYRQPLIWNEKLLEQNITTLDKVYKKLEEFSDVVAEPKVHPAVLDALNDDLNTPLAFAEVFKFLKDPTLSPAELKSYLLGSGFVLGLFQQNPADWFASKKSNISVDEGYIKDMIAQRINARKERNFAKADEIRDTLLKEGIALEDTPQGTIWKTA